MTACVCVWQRKQRRIKAKEVSIKHGRGISKQQKGTQQQSVNTPTVLESMNVKAECGADGADVLPVEFLYDRRFACIVQPTVTRREDEKGCVSEALSWAVRDHSGCQHTHRMSNRTSFSCCLTFLRIASRPMLTSGTYSATREWFLPSGRNPKNFGRHARICVGRVDCS